MQRKTTNHLRGYRTEVQKKISAIKSRTRSASESARQTLAQIGAICRHELRFAPRWVKCFPSRRILDEIWRRTRKNDHRDTDKPIQRKTASRTDQTVPDLDENMFFYVRLRFTPFRRRFTAGIGRHSGDHDFLRLHFLPYISNKIWLLSKWSNCKLQVLESRTPPDFF